MKLMEWNDSFSVGNVLMDAHHRVFFEMIKEFSEHPDKNNHDAVKEHIAFLIEYAAMHLGAEEELMLKANYPGFDEHKMVHDAFTQDLLSLNSSFSKDPDSITADTILKVMQHWLVSHIMDSDKRYMPYIQKLQS